MSSSSVNVSTSYGSNKWSLYTEQLLSATCVGWCLRASFKEHPKSTTLAFAGGASGIFLANFFRNRLASKTENKKLLLAGGFLSVAGIAWCLKTAIDEHPKAALKACLGGALSICLTKSVIYDNFWAIVKENPEINAIRRIPSASVMFYSTSNTPIKLDIQVKNVGEELRKICKEFYEFKHEFQK